MTDPRTPGGRSFGTDTWARKLAMEAKEIAQTAQAAVFAATPPTCRLGSAKTGLLLTVGASTDLPVTWSTPMPSATYTVEAVAGPGMLGSATLTVKSQTRSGCVITVTAGVVITAGAIVFAHAYS